MKLTIFGATGGTGAQVLQQALAAGHIVTILARDPAKVTTQNPHLTVVAGNVLNQSDVEKALAQAETVVCSLGNTGNNPADVVSAGTQQIVNAMQRRGIKRLIVVSSLGVGDSKNQVPFFFKVLAATVLRKTMKDKEAQEALVRASGLDWTIVRPGGLTDGPRTGGYRFGTDASLTAGQVTRADVADFILRELERNEFVRMTPAIT
ncbi:MAG: NAD(P)-dependent oxidoreductase [Caldilineaceae bacterium]|jgi:putative NADH-flavin reductase